MLWAPLEFGAKTSAQKEGRETVVLIGLIDGTIILHLFTYTLLISVNFFNFSKGGGITSSPFILIIYLYWYSYIVYFVCDSASEFGAMGSTSFFGSPALTCFLFF